MKLSSKLALTIIMGIACVGCRYEDGPKLTVRSAKNRAVASWYMYKCTQDGADKTSDFNTLFPNWLLVLKKDNTYSLSFTFFNGKNEETGNWEFQDGGKKINLKKDGKGTNIWTLTRLKNHELWAEQKDDNGQLIVYHLRN